MLDYINAVTMYELSFTPNASVTAGDVISIEFTTNDGLEDALFEDKLGKTVNENSTAIISCHESAHANVISDSPITC